MRTLELGHLPFAAWIQLVDGSLSDADLVREPRGSGVEDWFYVGKKPASELVVYELDVSQFHSLRLVNRVLEFLDQGGAPQLRMAAPWLLDQAGQVHQLSVDIVDCAVDRDPRAPWGRDVMPLDRDLCRVELSWSLPESSYPLWVDPFWSPTNLMTSPRALHSATLLPGGLVLIAGGTSDVLSEVATCELFDPGTGTFATTGPLSESKRAHRAIALDDGRVLVVAGDSGTAPPYSSSTRVERYDAASGEWTRLGDLPTQRSSPNIVRLQSGELLLTGGWLPANGDSVDAVARCDALGEACQLVAPMLLPRHGHAAAVLQDGRVLVAGGGENIFEPAATIWSSTELFDPGTDLWTEGPSLLTERTDIASVLLSDGRLLLTGGSTQLDGVQSLSAALEIIDPQAPVSEIVGALTVPRWLHSSSLLPNGKVLTAGASGPNFTPSTVVTTEVFDPLSLSSKLTGTLPQPTSLHQATLLQDGRVLITGGFSGAVSDLGTLFGDALGTACSPDDPASCPNGACVDGTCEADFPVGPGTGGAGGSGGATGGTSGASSGGGGSGTGAAGAGATPSSTDVELQSFYGCSSPVHTPSPASVLIVVGLWLCARRARESR